MQLVDVFGSGCLVEETTCGAVSLLRGHPIGAIEVPSGRVRVGDPTSCDGHVVEVPPGLHPVIVATNEMDGGHDTVGLMLRVQGRRLARWRRATTIGVDGATVAIGEADAKVPRARLELPGRLGGGRIGRRVAAVRLGSDGGYPLRLGLDPDGQVAAVAVVTLDLRTRVRWKGARGLDPGDLDACLAWAREVGADESLVQPGRTDLEELRAIRRIPTDLRRYYQGHDAGDLRRYRAIAERRALRGALPIRVFGDDAMVYLDEHDRVVTDDHGAVVGVHIDLRAWLVLSTISVFGLS